MANDHTLSREHATTQRAGPHEDPLTASSGRPSEERVTGHQEGSRGLIIPSRRMYSTAPVRGFILLVPTRFTEIHISSPVSSMCLRAKDHLEGTKVAVFPRNCAEQKVQTGSAAAGGHRGVATRKTTGVLTTRRGAGDPERRAEWTTVSRYGHLQSALVVVDACYARSGNRLHSVQPCVVSTRAWRLLDGFLPLRRCTNASLRSDAFSVQKVHVRVPRDPFHQLILALTGCGCHCATLFLQGNSVFAVDTEIVSQRRVSQQQHLSRDCPISQVFWLSLEALFSRHTEYDEVVSASHSWHACTKSVSFAVTHRPKGCRRRCATLSRLLGADGSLRLHR